jgi:serine/threonine protein kinase/ligand-binding sensor domain-containing protein
VSLRPTLATSAAVLLLLGVTPARAGDDVALRAVPNMRLFADKDGVPQSSILAMATEKNGRVWIGTQDGPAVHDGQGFVPVPLPSGAESVTVDAIDIAADGSVWLATDGGGVWRRAPGEHWTHYGKDEGLPSEHVAALAEATPGVMWAGTTSGLARLEGERWVTVDLAPSGMGAKVYVLSAGMLPSGEPTLWVGGEGGLAHCEGTHCASFRNKKEGLPGDVYAVLQTTAEDGTKSLWVATDHGLARFADARWEIFDVAGGSLPFDEVHALAETVSGSGRRTLWVGTYGGGIARLSGGRWTSINSKNSRLQNDYISSLLPSTGPLGSRTIFIGTDGGGLARLRHDAWAGLSVRASGLPGSGAFGIFETPGEGGGPSEMWFATDGGLGRWTGKGWKVYGTKDKSLPTDYVLAVTRWPRDPKALWLGTYEGLVRWVEGGPPRVITPQNSPLRGVHVHLVRPSQDGQSLFIGTDEGAAIWHGEDAWEIYTHATSPVAEGGVRAIVETTGPHGTRGLWIGSDGGLARLEEGRWSTYDTRNSPLQNHEILGITEVHDASGGRVLWIGAATGGVARYDLVADRWLETLSGKSRPALPDDTVYEVRQDALHRIYLFTNRGVARLTPRAPTPDDASSFSIYTYTTEDGIPSNECNSGGAFVDSSGRIWTGTIVGAGVFDPADEVADTAPKTLLLEPPHVGDDARALSAGDALAWDENALEFRYSLLSPMRDGDTRFRTQLLGFDRRESIWSADTKSKYTNLPEGSYAFRVWGRDYAGNESGPVEIAFRVKPAPWRTWWAWISYALALGAIAYGGHRVRLRRLRQHTRELEARVAERTAELDAKNEQLAVNLRELAVAQVETQRKNSELDGKVAELARKNLELEESHRRADVIFSALADVLPGIVLDGKYRLEEKIGTGGFGAVFRATHLALGREVAVKVFRPSQGNDSPQALERFRAEGATACRVNHPNAVQIFDSGISGEGIAFLVMELLNGRTLADEISDGHTVPLRRCSEILDVMCSVLSAAHDNGLIHRDIKPDNVFLHKSPGGEELVKVVDFGIAKLMGLDALHPDATGTLGLVGTPSYMAPERFGGEPYDARSDVYSVGVTLFEMITGQLPYPHGDRPVFDIVLRQLTEAPVEVTTLNSLVPDEAARIVMRCLSKDPAARPTLRELAQTFATEVDVLPDSVKDTTYVVQRLSIKLDARKADQLADTMSFEAKTQQRGKSSRPPPSRRPN